MSFPKIADSGDFFVQQLFNSCCILAAKVVTKTN
jgi:hypothetical protein